MICFVNAKINIGLHVVKRLENGYHELQTIFYPVGLYAGEAENPESFCDILEVTCAPEVPKVSERKIKFRSTGRRIDCPVEKNLAYRAASLYFENYVDDLFSAEIILEKYLPDGAGMGGGSADAAFTLKMLRDIHASFIKSNADSLGNDFSRLESHVPDDDELSLMAKKLGADCPFFLYNKPAYATGIGEKITPIDIDLTGKWLVVLKPGVSISTAAAFAGITPKKPDFDLKYITDLKIEDWKKFVKNDFEIPFFSAYPEMKEIKENLYETGAEYASLTGSGSCIYGIFQNQETAEKAKMQFISYPTIKAAYLLKL